MNILRASRAIAGTLTLVVLFACFVNASHYPPIIDIIAYIDFSPIHTFQEYWRKYNLGNPRIGEIALIASAGNPIARGAACLLGVIALIVGGFLLLEGRLPKPLKLADAFWGALFLALLAAFNKNPGGALFYLPHNANYVLTFGILLLFLGMYRKAFDGVVFPTGLLFVAGFVAGMTNEHTPPTIAGLILLWTLFQWWRGMPPRRREVESFAGLSLGFLALLFAPGQSQRYGGQGGGVFNVSLDVILAKAETLWIFYTHSPLVFTAPALLIAATVQVLRASPADLEARKRIVISWGLFLASIGMTITLVFAPFLPQRLMVASNAAVALSMLGAIWSLSRDIVFLKWAAGAAAAIAAIAFLQSAYTDIQRYKLQYDVREELAAMQIASGCKDLVFPAYTVRPGDTILEDGQHTDPRHWLNVARARYLGVDSVSIQEARTPFELLPCGDGS